MGVAPNHSKLDRCAIERLGVWDPPFEGPPQKIPKAALSIAMFNCHCNQSLIAAHPSAQPTENISADM